MAWLFFIDESGHDRRVTPYEVRGGFAIHVGQLWSFVQAMQELELESFGCRLHEYGNEIKESTLLDKKRFKFAEQGDSFNDAERRRLCRSFFAKNRKDWKHIKPQRDEFTAYGQACLYMVSGTFRLLRTHGAVLFASVIPRDANKPSTYQFDEYLRKDVVFLLERFFYFLREKREHGILVMDETEKHGDRGFVSRLERYFTRTATGRHRTTWIVPTPLFVSSDMTYAVQAADVCIYCVNWGFRLPRRGMGAETREEIATMSGAALANLQYRGRGDRDGQIFDTYGICYVPDPYEPRTAQ